MGGSAVVKFSAKTFQGHFCVRITDAYVLV